MLHQSYCEEILNQSMKKKIPSWDSLSPADPMKVFAEGVLGSLIETEKLSHQRTSRLLSLLPSFLGFKPRAALAPRGYFELRPSEMLKSNWFLPLHSAIQYEFEENVWNATSLESLEVLPVQIETQKNSGLTSIIQFRITKPCRRVTTTYLPFHLSESRVPQLLSTSFELKQWNAHLELYEVVPESTYRIHYSSSFWDRALQVTIEPLAPDSSLFSHEDGLYEASWAHSSPVPNGRFYTNLFPFEITQTCHDSSIGFLKGLPWEEVPLPRTIIRVPDEIEIFFPSNEKLVLRRIDSQILVVHQDNPDLLQSSFIYDPIQHSIVIPSAFQIMQQYQGGVSIHLQQHSIFPREDWIPSGAKLVFGGFFGMIDTIVPVQLESKSVQNENPTHYLERFYSCLKSFMTYSRSEDSFSPYFDRLDPANTIGKTDLELDLLAHSPVLSALEVQVEPTHQRVNIFIEDQTEPTIHPRSVSPELIATLEKRLKEILPIQYHWNIRTFEDLPIQIHLEISLNCRPERLHQIDKGSIEKWIQKRTEHHFSPRGTPHQAPLPWEALTEIYKELFRHATDRSLPTSEEMDSILVWGFSPITGETIKVPKRQIGQNFRPTHQVLLKNRGGSLL